MCLCMCVCVCEENVHVSHAHSVRLQSAESVFCTESAAVQ